MYNNAQNWVTFTGSCQLVASTAIAIIAASGSNVPIGFGTTNVAIASGTTTLSGATTATLSGTSFQIIAGLGQFQLTGTSNATTPPAGTVISVTGSDDWATLQAVLTSGSGTGLVLHLDSAFCLTKSLRLYSDESVESDGSPAHGPHLLAHSDCPIFTTVMVGGQYCGHDIAIHNVFEDCNGFNQDINEASNSWELQGDLAPVEWTHANDIGSVINFTMDGCTIYDSASYALFTHWIQHFKITNNRTCYSIFNGPPYWPYGATHRDGWHGDGPEYDGIVTGITGPAMMTRMRCCRLKTRRRRADFTIYLALPRR